ncbi:hypothetical protein RUM44_009912 [Polyplax serrata]|uniref:Sensory neuron membrane protein 2 n=1 Tax=Polyplax serrata TaxID=468196 RepID=A0ABR1AU16_POLSC
MALKVHYIVGVTGVFVVLLGAIIGWIILPMVVRNKIADIIPLKENSESFKRWKDPPVPIYFSVYVFHVNNPDDIIKGATPSVTEKGPYVYRETRHREVLSAIDENDTITYRQRILFEFDQKASGNLTEDDVYTVVNMQALALSQVVNNLKVMNPAIFLLNTALPKLWPTNTSNPLFVKAPVKEFLFGQMPMYCNQSLSVQNIDVKVLCEAVKIFKPKTVILDGGGNGIHTFSLFRYKNTTYDGIYAIKMGVNDVTNIGNIKTWNDSTKLKNWKSDSCNTIVGTDSTVFRPYLYEDGVQSLYIFNTDACRSIKLNRDGFLEYKGINGIKYVTDESTFASVLENSDNFCYCPQSIHGITHWGGCLKSGIVELSSCYSK